MPTAKAKAMSGKVMQWAREQAGLTAHELGERLKKDAAIVEAWEDDDSDEFPTLRQLEAVAAAVRLPLAVFFFPEPPELPDTKAQFRMLPEPDNAVEARDTALAIREASLRQQQLLDLGGDRNPVAQKFLFGGRSKQLLSAEALRRKLGVAVETQLSWRDPKKALHEWREALGKVGIYVFKRPFKQKSISGFCLPHDRVPVIMLNNATTYTRQVFTVFHELRHLAHHHHGVTRSDPGYLDHLDSDERQVEVDCNRFAGLFLLPPDSFDQQARAKPATEETVKNLARDYSVSREVVARRLKELGIISQAKYAGWAGKWNLDFHVRPKRKRPGGNPYRNQKVYLGLPYLRVVYGAFFRGTIDVSGVADYTGVKARNIERFEAEFRGDL